jgi:hypothetical protein
MNAITYNICFQNYQDLRSHRESVLCVVIAFCRHTPGSSHPSLDSSASATAVTILTCAHDMSQLVNNKHKHTLPHFRKHLLECEYGVRAREQYDGDDVLLGGALSQHHARAYKLHTVHIVTSHNARDPAARVCPSSSTVRWPLSARRSSRAASPPTCIIRIKILDT